MRQNSCQHCGKQLDDGYGVKYCSQECFHEGNSFAGENNPNYKGGKAATECRICGRRFKYYPSDKKGWYCPECVETEEWRTPPTVTGTDNPRWKGGKIEKECDVCGKKVRRYPSGFENDVVCCSEECRQTWLSEAFTGEGHPNWKGGPGDFYNDGWWPAKLAALDRDGHTCRVCGATKDELGRNPDVHHIVPVREFAEAEDAEIADAHALDNLVSLCVTCHRNADVGNISEAALRDLIPVDRG